jgi:hypothetical protein
MPRRSPIFRNRPPATQHFVELCACGAPVAWCRCCGPSSWPPVIEVRDSDQSCEECSGADLYDLEWTEVGSSGIKVPNPAPPVRPVTLALDLIEVRHQAGAAAGRTRISPEQWESIFYRGDAAHANRSAKERAFERWKSAVRAFGFECSPSERGDAERGTFCVSMARAIPWAERVLDESARRASEKRQRRSVRTAANSGSLVRIHR